jgi:hypothetical protein
VSPEHSQETKTKRSPVGIFYNMTWDKDALKLEVESYEDGKFVNWSQLAKEYNVTNTKGEFAENGSQIAKEWLKSVGVDTDRFKRYNTNSDGPRIRRKKRRDFRRGDINSNATNKCVSGETITRKNLTERIFNWEVNCS